MGGCGSERFGAPDPGSEQGQTVLDLWNGAVIAALVVGLVVYVLVVVVVVRYRRRGRAEVPSQQSEHIPLEVTYFAIPVIIVAVLFAFTVAVERDVTATVAEPDLVVDVDGFQWQWRFTYVDDGVVLLGDNQDDPPELVLPVGRTVRLRLTSTDVNHSFWVPGFLVKRDLIPGIDNQIDVDVTRPGVHDGKCAEFCGLDHYRMNFVVRAVPAAEFDSWLADQVEAAR